LESKKDCKTGFGIMNLKHGRDAHVTVEVLKPPLNSASYSHAGKADEFLRPGPKDTFRRRLNVADQEGVPAGFKLIFQLLALVAQSGCIFVLSRVQLPVNVGIQLDDPERYFHGIG